MERDTRAQRKFAERMEGKVPTDIETKDIPPDGDDGAVEGEDADESAETEEE